MTDLLEIPAHEWNEANRRALAIRPLLEFKHCPCEKAREVADELGLSERQIYRLIQRLRESGGKITALLPQGSHGGRGKRRLALSREILLQRLIAEIFITPQKLSTANLIRAVRNQSLSDKAACLTLEELERWLAIAITKYYHLRPHEGMNNEIPLHLYEQGLQKLFAANKTLAMPRDPRTFLIDFLPVVRRSLQRDGITIDHITYYSHSLRPWIQLRDQPTRLLIRRDPRDLSRIFVLDG